MSKNNYKIKMPDLMEAIFDACYLIFDLIAGILFLYIQKEIHCLFIWCININIMWWRCIPFGSSY